MVIPARIFSLPVLELQARDPSYRQRETRSLPVRKAKRPFGLSGSRPLRTCLLREKQATMERRQYFLQERLPEYILPMAFSFLEAGLLTPGGASDRREQTWC
jgi:hypothetical protein